MTSDKDSQLDYKKSGVDVDAGYELVKRIKPFVKKTKNLIKWLLVWYKNSPPSVEYIEKLLITPKIKIHNKRMKSNDLSFWKKVDLLDKELCIYIMYY